jgi:diguanylate cyclase (GGDEF)-like protein/PAS domain S-box-containing protein
MGRIFTGAAARVACVGLAYFCAAAVTIGTTRYGGGVAFVWVANAILVAELSRMRPHRWAPTLATCFVASCLATTLFGYGLWGALPFGIVNCMEAVIGASFMRRMSPEDRLLGSGRGVTIFILGVGIFAPAATGLCAGTLAFWFGGDFGVNALRWFMGHALGALTFAPIANLLISGKLREWVRGSDWDRRLQGALVLVGVACVTVFTFSQSALPLLFLPVLPTMVATFRFGRLGAAGSLLLVTIIGVYFTLSGSGPVTLIAGARGDQLQFLQLYLAITVLTVLPVASALAQRKRLYLRLRDSEARYRLLSDHTTDVVMSLDPDGTIRFVSKSIGMLGGYGVDEMVGRNSLGLVHPIDRAAVQAAHAAALSRPGETQMVEYRGLVADGGYRWCETTTQGVFDDDGQANGVVSVVRDISHRKLIESDLLRQANTDSLTGLFNRRAFAEQLHGALRSKRDSERGCIALFDIDHFKRINDAHGHATGDKVLQEFAAAARRELRDGDAIARVGGEEFAVLLRGASLDQAVAVCDRFRAHVAVMSIAGPDGEPVSVTVSAGIAMLEPGQSQEALMGLADAALYRAKRAGRNCLKLAA